MYFLIDYENVNYAGLEGTEFLMKEDTIIFFFSKDSDKIVKYRMMDIEDSGCIFDICKLKNISKNALDFYIASRVGEIFTQDPSAKIGIISADKDYQAVMDYWRPRLKASNQLTRSRSIAKAISFANPEKDRKTLVDDRMKTYDLQNMFAQYEERNATIDRITGLLSGTDYEKSILSIIDVVLVADTMKQLYLNLLKKLGRASGIEVYRRLKVAYNK